MPSRDTPASSRTEASMAALVRSGCHMRGQPAAPRLTFGRSVAKAMDVFDLDSARWPEHKSAHV